MTCPRISCLLPFTDRPAGYLAADLWNIGRKKLKRSIMSWLRDDELIRAMSLEISGGQHALDQQDVHVCLLPLDETGPKFSFFHSLLSADERERLQSFHFERERVRFVLARGFLRVLVGRCCGVPAGEVRFCYSEYGKPSVAAPGSGLHFSVAHSEGLAVYALSRSRRVGIDVERMRSFPDMESLVNQSFAEEEVEAYQALPGDRRLRGFFNAWTRKEAYVKALGMGLSYPLRTFAVSLTPGEPPRFLRSNAAVEGEWTLYDLTADERYVIALAVEGKRFFENS